jgi:hypothetical protein
MPHRSSEKQIWKIFYDFFTTRTTERKSERMRVWACVCVCVCVRERDREEMEWFSSRALKGRFTDNSFLKHYFVLLSLSDTHTHTYTLRHTLTHTHNHTHSHTHIAMEASKVANSMKGNSLDSTHSFFPESKWTMRQKR